MKLHKAFSSLNSFPKINSRKKLNDKIKKIEERNFFLTINTADDVNFAKDINDKIEKKLMTKRMNNLKLIKKSNHNDIYSPNWTRNKNILRNLKKNLNLETNNFFFNTYDRKDYKEVFKTESRNIFNSYLTAHNYKYVYLLKNKFLKLNTNADKLLSNSKQLGLDNYISNLLKNERTKISTNEKEYQNSLIKENTILNKDIKKFGIYQVNQNLKFQNSEGTVQKYIKANSILFEAMKQAQLEYHATYNKIQNYIKEIVRLEELVLFIYSILGVEESESISSSINKYKISINETSQTETEKNIYNINFHSKLLFKKLFDEVAEELKSDDEKLYFAINNREKMILKRISEKDDINMTRYKNEKDFKNDMQYFQKKHDNFMSEYILILRDYEDEMQKYNLALKNSQLSAEFQDIINFISEIKYSLFNKKDKKQISDNLIYRNLVIPCLEKLKEKEFFIDEIFKKMDEYEKKDKKIFNNCVNICKMNNRIKKFQKEKELIKEKEIKEKLRILSKHKKIIFKNKYKYSVSPQKK